MVCESVNQHQQDNNLKQQLDKIDWPIYYGSIKVQLRDGKITLVTVERTVKFD